MEEFKHLEWDSSFFGFPIASVIYTNELNTIEVLEKLKELDYTLVYLFIQKPIYVLSNNLISKYGGILVDRKVTYRRSLKESAFDILFQGIRVNTYNKVNDELVELALTAGAYSRFNIDPNFNKIQFQNLYTDWIKNSISGSMAEYVITYHSYEKPVGLATLKIAGEIGKIGLISVSDKIQNKGIGSSLLNEVFAICTSNGLKTIEVVTQEDYIKACRFYEKNCFIKYKMDIIYHFWLKKNDPF